jgi:hypothetical protein
VKLLPSSARVACPIRSQPTWSTSDLEIPNAIGQGDHLANWYSADQNPAAGLILSPETSLTRIALIDATSNLGFDVCAPGT